MVYKLANIPIEEYFNRRIALKLFQDIAIEVIRYKKAVMIEEKGLWNLIAKCKDKTIMGSILDLFDESKQIEIIENKGSN